MQNTLLTPLVDPHFHTEKPLVNLFLLFSYIVECDRLMLGSNLGLCVLCGTIGIWW